MAASPRLVSAILNKLAPVQDVPQDRPDAPPPPAPYAALGISRPVRVAQAAPEQAPPPPKAIDAMGSGDMQDYDRPSGNSKAAHDIQGDLLDAEKQYDKLRYIQNLYSPEMLDKNKILKNWMANQKDAWGGHGVVGAVLGKASADEKAELEKYSAWRQAALGAINDYIHDMTGAQLGEGEAKRLIASQPNPGIGTMNGMFDADSPTAYQAKLSAQMKYLRRAITRATFYSKIGVPYAKHMDEVEKTMPLFDGEFDPNTPDWKAAMKARVKELRDRGLKDDAIAHTITDEFGL